MRYIRWVYRDAASRALRADEAERLLHRQCWCLAIASGVVGVIAPPAVALALFAAETDPPSGFLTFIVFMNSIWLAAAFGVWRFAGSIRFLVQHIEMFGLAPRPGRRTVEKEGGESRRHDPLSAAMGMPGMD